MPAPHALYSKMLAERTASRNVLVLFYFIIYDLVLTGKYWNLEQRRQPGRESHPPWCTLNSH